MNGRAMRPSVSTGEEREIAFVVGGHPCVLPLDPPGDERVASVFLVGLPKAGSTLLNLMMRPLLEAAGLAYVTLPGALRDMGVPPRDIPEDVNRAFRPAGYAFGGFRSLPGAFALPPYAAGRTVLLVRDPRDMLTSLYFSVALSHPPPGGGVGGVLARKFEANRDRATDIGIDQFVLNGVRNLISQFGQVERKLATIPHRLYRYETVIFDKLTWASDMVRYLDLAVDAGAVERAVARHDLQPTVEDATKHVRRVTPGDHAEKLRPETIARLNERLGPILAMYGYA